MIQSSNNKQKSIIDSNLVHKIASFRAIIQTNSQFLVGFQQIVESFTSALEYEKAGAQKMRLSLKGFHGQLKKALKQPSGVLEDSFRKSLRKQADFLFQAKKGQQIETLKTVAELSLMFKLLASIKSQEAEGLNSQQQIISTEKRTIISIYREAIGYIKGRELLLQAKEREKIDDLLKKHSSIQQNSLLKQQLQQIRNEQKGYQSIYQTLEQIQQKLIGFRLGGSKKNSITAVKVNLESVLQYINRSCNNKQSAKISPISVKNQIDISHILNLIHNGNVGLLSEKAECLSDPATKEAVKKMVELMQKNSDAVEQIYANLVKNMRQKSQGFSRNLRHLPFSRKLQQCKKISGINTNSVFSNIFCDSIPQSKLQKMIDEERQKRNQIQQQNAEKDKRLVQFQEQKYELQTEIEKYRRLLMDKNAQIGTLKDEKAELSQNIRLTTEKIQKLQGQMLQNLQKLRQLQLQSSILQQSKQTLQTEVCQIISQRQAIEQQIARIRAQKNEVIAKYEQLKCHSSLEFRQLTLAIHSNISYKIEPDHQSPISKFDDYIIQEIFESPLAQTPSTPPRHSLQTSRKKTGLRHARSYSIVDICSELLPQSEDKPQPQPSDSISSSNDQIQRGIQIRQRTIKRYEAYMQKQRQEAKKYRSQIFDLESKIRALEIQRIRLNQLVQDRSSQQELRMIDEEGQGQEICSLVEIRSMQKLSDKEVELKVKEDELNFQIEEVIKHVLKLKTLKPTSSPIEGITDIQPELSDNPEYKLINQ